MPTKNFERLLSDIKVAMKARDKEKLSALRYLHSEIKNYSIKEGREPEDEDVVAVVTKLIKQRREAAEQFSSAGREDLVEKEESQVSIYQAYQPAQLGAEELEALVVAAIQKTGASGRGDMGKVMGVLMPQTKGRADGKLVSRLVGEKLSAL